MAMLLLKLTLLMLLANITQARSEPLPNAGEFDQDLNKKGFTIPYLKCIRTCHNCACTKVLPVEANFCACMDTKSKTKPTDDDDELVHKYAAGIYDQKLPRKGRIPYLECIRTCHRCACTKMLPVEANFCTCMDAVVDIQTNTKPTDNELLHKSAVGKNSWPELVGIKGETAAAKIKRENPQVDAIVIKEGTPTTDDRRHNRVRVWVDEHGVVTTVPRRG